MYSLNMKYKPILSELKISIEKEKPDWCMPTVVSITVAETPVNQANTLHYVSVRQHLLNIFSTILEKCKTCIHLCLRQKLDS